MPDHGDAQAGGVSSPFTVCVHSWFEVCEADCPVDEHNRLATAAHRRAEFLRPSPSVHIRGLRCGGACGRARGEVGWGEREG